MNFSLTKDQQEYQNGIRAFAKDNFGGSYVDRDKDNFFSREDWEKCAAFGLQGLATPIAYGGSTDDLNILPLQSPWKVLDMDVGIMDCPLV